MDMEKQMPASSLHKNSCSSPTVRFLGLLQQPKTDSVPFELDEIDVVWSSDLSDSSESESVSLGSITFPSSTVPISPSNHLHHQFRPRRFGLSAALSEDRRTLVLRNSALNPSLSAATAARTIPPVPIPRSGGSTTSPDLSTSSLGGRGKFHQSAPVNVPVWPRGIGNALSYSLSSFNVDDDEDTEEEMLQPHEIVARSHATTFSMFEGVGRTLKGRDLRSVRNAVFQKTGFLN